MQQQSTSQEALQEQSIRPKISLKLSQGDRVALAILIDGRPIILKDKFKIIRMRDRNESIIIKKDGVLDDYRKPTPKDYRMPGMHKGTGPMPGNKR